MKIQPVKKLSLTELQERKSKGLCYNCNEKYTPGHECIKLFIIEAVGEEETRIMGKKSSVKDQEDQAEISLSAMNGRVTPDTMRVLGEINGVQVIMLLDSGSTENFISLNVVQALKLPVDTSSLLKVGVASGVKILSKGICKKIRIRMQKQWLEESFHVIHLNLVLGATWLKKLVQFGGISLI